MMKTTELKRDLGSWAATAIVIGTVIGSGIFIVPQTMIQRVGSVEMVFVVWVVGGLLSMAGALSYAELSSAIPEAGGEYAYLREAYGPLWGFLYSWTQMWVAKSGSIATLASGFYVYFANFFPVLKTPFYSISLPFGRGELTFLYGQLLGIVLILLLAWLNYCGVKLGGEVQVAVTILKVALIAAVILAGLGLGTPHPPAATTIAQLTFFGFIAALVKSLWAYDGWNNVSMVSSEIRDPQRNLPRALIGGTLAVAAIYLLANCAYFYVLSPAEVASTDRVASEMMRRIFSNGGANAVAIAAMISMFAALNGSILTGSRVPYAAAREGYFFKAVGQVTPKYHSPGVSIIVMSVWSCLLLLSGKYDDLLDLVIFASWIMYGMTAAAVIVLRRKRTELARPYKTLGYPLVPLLFVAGASIIILTTAVDKPFESIKGILLIISGLPFYFYWKARRA
jgi:APA family basic amino acid/polyamine antiporter